VNEAIISDLTQFFNLNKFHVFSSMMAQSFWRGGREKEGWSREKLWIGLQAGFLQVSPIHLTGIDFIPFIFANNSQIILVV